MNWRPNGLTAHVAETMGQAAAEQTRTILERTQEPGHGWAWLAGMALLLLGATGVLQELQTALNRAWGVQPDPDQGGLRHFILKRMLSLAMLLAIAFLLLVSLIVSWLLAEFGGWVESLAPQWLSQGVIFGLNAGLSLAIITLLFAAMLKFLPDAEIAWRDVWPGAIATSLLFVAGKTALGIYLAWSDPTSAFGAAGSVVLMLLWIYYSAMIFFLGAEFTQVRAARLGRAIVPEPGAMRAEYPGGEAAQPAHPPEPRGTGSFAFAVSGCLAPAS